MSSTIEKSIEVNVPVRVAYNQWTQFEDFPLFMEGIKQVKQIGEKKTLWVAEVGFKEKQWEADIIEQVPDTRIAWRNSTGVANVGIVSFIPLDGDRTKVTARITYHPESFVEQAGDFLGFVSRRVEGDLERYKKFIEERGHATGGWRGEIHAGKPESSDK